MKRVCIERFFLFLLFFFSNLLLGATSHCIILVHIGQTLPQGLETALVQARLFNPDCPIVLIANSQALHDFSSSEQITLVPCESLPCTLEHEQFLEQTKFKAGYMRFTSERFLYLYDYMVAFDVKNVFHIENDVMLYADLGELLPIIQENYMGMATTFESNKRCIPGFVYIPNVDFMQKLAKAFIRQSSKRSSDMNVIGLFWNQHPEEIDCLPMIMNQYLVEQTPVSHENGLLKLMRRHSKHIDAFNSIFDGNAIGVFFDGLHPDKGNFPPGFLMKQLFNASKLSYKWEVDEKGRKVPFAIYGEECFRINNLHIASKRLERFSS